ncbi:MAG: sugar phosphate isomerase/epimerase [Planctomycetota bacterium]|nr:sugar phosphate isomerase/epimerase [Planctomycetota bacterium]
MFRLGYNTNGLAHHRVVDALRLLAELGYEGVALTPDAGRLDPYDLDADHVAEVRRWSEELGLGLAIETGSRFLLDAKRKHFPTLLEEEASDRARRVDFLERCVDLAAELGADVVSLWAGAAPDGTIGDRTEIPPGVPGTAVKEAERARDELWDRLCEGLVPVLARGRAQGVRIAFEPEPGMFVERPAGYEELLRRLEAEGDDLGLCLDVGHLLCSGDLPVGDVIRRYARRLAMVHLDDVKDGVHEHRMFGSGDLDLPGTLGALLEVGYDGMAAVELSRDSHRGAEAAGEALGHLRRALTAGV